MEICSTGLGIPKLGEHRVPSLRTGRTGVTWAAPALDWTVVLHQLGRKHRNPIKNPSSRKHDSPEELHFLLSCPLHPCSRGTPGWWLGHGRAMLLCPETCPTPAGQQHHLSPPWGLFQSHPQLFFPLDIFDPIQPPTPALSRAEGSAQAAKPIPIPCTGSQPRSKAPRAGNLPLHPPCPWCFFTPEGSSPFARPCSYRKKIYFQLSPASVARQPSRLHIFPGSGSSGEAL